MKEYHLITTIDPSQFGDSYITEAIDFGLFEAALLVVKYPRHIIWSIPITEAQFNEYNNKI